MNARRALGEALMADQAYDRLIAVLRDGRLAAGQFVSMPGLVEMLDLPLAADARGGEAGRRQRAGAGAAEARRAGDGGLRRGHARLHGPARHARRRGGAAADRGRGRALPLAELRASHEALIEEAERAMTAELPRRAIETDLSLHDALVWLARQSAGGRGLPGEPRPDRGDPEHPRLPARPHRAGDARASRDHRRPRAPRRRGGGRGDRRRTTARRCAGGASSSDASRPLAHPVAVSEGRWSACRHERRTTDGGSPPRRQEDRVSSVIHVGAWSLAFSRPRTARSTPAATRRGARAGLRSRWSRRIPPFRSQRFRR